MKEVTRNRYQDAVNDLKEQGFSSSTIEGVHVTRYKHHKTYYNPTNNVKKYRLLPPKTVTSKRKISVDKIVIDELKKHRARQNLVRMENRDTYHNKHFIFTKESEYPGYPELIKTIENRMHRLLKFDKVNTDLTPHSLKHTPILFFSQKLG